MVLEGGAAPLSAAPPDPPAALLNDTVDRREPEPRTPPRLFGREKRLEQARLGRVIHAHTRAADGEQAVRARLGWHVPGDAAGIGPDIPPPDRERPSLRHGCPGIPPQVPP